MESKYSDHERPKQNEMEIDDDLYENDPDFENIANNNNHLSDEEAAARKA